MTKKADEFEELKEKIKILCAKVIKIKPELQKWVEKNFTGTFADHTQNDEDY